MKLLSLWLIVLLSFGTILYSQNTISGVVLDSAKQCISDIIVQTVPHANQSFTDAEGRFEIQISNNDSALIFQSLGYRTKIVRLQDIRTTKNVRVILDHSSISLPQILITEQKMNLIKRLNANSLLKSIERLPTIGGFSDPFQAIMKIPGVQPALEGFAQYHVRGFESTQNQYLLNGVPTFESSHLLNLISVYNPKMTDNLEFYKYGVPIAYNGNLASYFNGSFKDPDVQFEKEIELDIGTLHSGISLKGLNKTKKLYYSIAGRVAYPSFIGLFSSAQSVKDGFKSNYENFGFADIQWNLLFNPLNPNSRFRIFGLVSNDNIRSTTNDIGIGYTDGRYEKLSGVLGLEHSYQRANFRLKNILGGSIQNINAYDEDKASLTVFDTLTRRPIGEVELINRSESSSQNALMFAQSSLSIAKDDISILTLGLNYRMDNLSPSRLSLLNTDEEDRHAFIAPKQTFKSYNLSMFAQYEHFFGRLHTTTGLSLHSYVTDNYNELYPQFRLQIVLPIKNNWELNANFDMTSQSNRSLQRSPQVLDMTDWRVSNQDYAVSQYMQANIGLSRRLGSWYYQLNGFLGRAKNLTTPVRELQLVSEQEVDLTLYANGMFKSLGFESLVEYRSRKGTFLQASYSYIRPEERFPTLQSGNYYTVGHAREHTIRLASGFRIGKKWSCFAQWEFGSPQRLDFPTTSAQGPNGTIVRIQHYRYEYKLPNFHRLDVGFSKKVNTFKRKDNATLKISIINLYNRENISGARLIERINSNANSPNSILVQGLSILPILPSINLTSKL